MRILITGSRDWVDEEKIAAAIHWAIINSSVVSNEEVTIMHGHCRTGADAIADELAAYAGCQIERHPARWTVNGKLDKSAGFARNAEMVRLGADICLAFIMPCRSTRCTTRGLHGSHGATMTANLAEQAGIKTMRFYP